MKIDDKNIERVVDGRPQRSDSGEFLFWIGLQRDKWQSLRVEANGAVLDFAPPRKYAREVSEAVIAAPHARVFVLGRDAQGEVVLPQHPTFIVKSRE